MGRRSKVRVELSLTAEVAVKVYERANEHDLTLSQAGERLLAYALLETTGLDSLPSLHGDGRAQNRRNE
ncbi:hypothetical protein DAVIS_05389 [Mycobacterium marinum]|uniref:CopG family transcriptional regulator n=1 Tax=Mycobacterium marinum TaxID=1781 RepID=A0A3E2MMX1_MYCMR|nr:hypothetical protein DAVIS_05389 [Mycobacterium marinum]